MKAKKVRNNLLKFKRLALLFVLVSVLSIIGGLNIGFKQTEIENYVFAATHNAGNNNYQLSIDDDIPIGESKSYEYNLLTGTGISSSTYSSFHRYTDGEFYDGGTSKKSVYSPSEIYTRTRNLKAGQCTEYYAYFRLPEELVFNKANLKVSMSYTVNDLSKVENVSASINSCVAIPTNDYNRGSIAGSKKNDTGNANGTYSIVDYKVNASNPYLRLGFSASVSEDISGAAVAANNMLFGITNVSITVTVLSDGSAPTITPWNFIGNDLEQSHSVYANNTDDMGLLFDTYYTIENNGRVNCHNLKYNNGVLDSNDKPEQNYFTSWQNAESKTISFVVYDKFMGLKEVAIGGYVIPVSSNTVTTNKTTLSEAMAANPELKLQGISEIKATSFGYKNVETTTGKFRGMQIQITFDCKDSDGNNIIGNTSYNIVGMDNGGVNSLLTVTIGGLDRTIPEVPAFTILDSAVNANGKDWYNNSTVRYRLTLPAPDAQKNVTYRHTLIRCDEFGGELETVLDNVIVPLVVYGSGSQSNTFTNLKSGQYKYRVTAIDAAGNGGTPVESVFWLDTTEPVCNVNIYYKNTTELYTLGSWSNKELEVKFSQINCISGYYYEYKIDNGGWIRENNQSIILGGTAENINSVYTFRVVTNAGKISKEYSTGEKIMIDTNKPGKPYSNSLVSYYDVETGYDGTAPIKMYIDIIGDDTGIDKQYGDLFMFYYTVGNEINGEIVYGYEQNATMTLASRGEALIDLYENGIPSFEGVSYIKKYIRMWCVDQAGNRSEEDSIIPIYVLPPVIYVDFIIDDNASKIYDNSNSASKLVNLEVRNSKQELITNAGASALKEDIITTTAANTTVKINYCLGDTVFINGVRYVITTEGLAGSGLSYVSSNNALNEVTLTVTKAGIYKITNFIINYSPIFVDYNAGERDITLDVLSSGKYVELIGANTESYTIKYRCSDNSVINIAENGENVVIGNATIEKAKILMFAQKNSEGNFGPINANDKIYDGKISANIARDHTTFVCTTNVLGDGWKNFTWDGIANFESADVSIVNGIVVDKNVIITQVELSGNSAEIANYEIITDIATGNLADINTVYTVKAKIIHRKLLVDTTASKVKEKVYDRSTDAEMELLVFKGIDENNNVLAGEQVTAEFNLELLSYAVNPNAQVYMKDIKLSGIDSANYLYVGSNQVSLTASIVQRPLTITSLTIKNKLYDGTDNAELDSYALNGVLTLDSTFVYLRYTSAIFNESNAGSHFGTVKGLSLDSSNAGKNYKIVDSEGNTITDAITTAQAKIEKRPLSVTATAGNKIYDGTTVAINPVISLTGMLTGDRVYIGSKLNSLDEANAYTGATFMFSDNESIPVRVLYIAFSSSAASTVNDSVVYFAYGKYVKYDEALHAGMTRYKVTFRETNNAAFYIINNQGNYEFFDREIHDINAQRYAVDEVEVNESGAYVLETIIYNADGSVNNNYTFEDNLIAKSGMKIFTTARARIAKKQASASIVGLIATDSTNNILYKDSDGNLYVKNGDNYDVFDKNGIKTGTVTVANMKGNTVFVSELEYGGYYTVNNKQFRLGSVNYVIRYYGGNVVTLKEFSVPAGETETFSFNYRVGETIYINGVEYILGTDSIEGVTYNGMFNDAVSLTFTEGDYIISGQEYDVFRSIVTNGYGINSPVNNYNIAISQVVNENYDFSGRLSGIAITIKPAKLIVSVNNDYNFNYGDQFTLNDLRVNYLGFRNGENTAVFGKEKPALVLTDSSGKVITITDETKLAVGKYYIRVTLPQLENYEYVVPDTLADGIAVYTLSSETNDNVTTYTVIKKNAVVINLGTLTGISFSDVTANYNNTALRLLAKGYPSNAKAIYTYYKINGDGTETLLQGVSSVTNAGTYRVNVLIKGNDLSYGYADFNASAVLTINKAVITLAIEKTKVENYTGNTVAIDTVVMTPDSSVTNIPSSSIQYQYSEDLRFRNICSAPNNAGIYYARAYFAGNNNYEPCYSNISTIRINPIYIPITITSGTKFVISDYFDEEGSPLVDKQGEEIIFKGIEISTIEDYEMYLDNVKIYYWVNSYWTEVVPTEQGVYNYKIITQSPYAIVGEGMFGAMLIGVNQMKTSNSSISVVDGALPSTNDSEAYYYVKTMEYKSDNPLVTNYNSIIENNAGNLNGKYSVNKLFNIQFYYTPDEGEEEIITNPGVNRMIVGFKTNSALAKGAKLVYIDNNGTVNELATTYDASTGMLTFETDSLGNFAIIEPVKVKLNTQMVAIICASVVVILLIVALIITLLAIRQKKIFQAPLKLATELKTKINNSSDTEYSDENSDE